MHIFLCLNVQVGHTPISKQSVLAGKSVLTGLNYAVLTSDNESGISFCSHRGCIEECIFIGGSRAWIEQATLPWPQFYHKSNPANLQGSLWSVTYQLLVVCVSNVLCIFVNVLCFGMHRCLRPEVLLVEPFSTVLLCEWLGPEPSALYVYTLEFHKSFVQQMPSAFSQMMKQS